MALMTSLSQQEIRALATGPKMVPCKASRAREMAQLVKCLPYKQEDLSSISRTHVKKVRHGDTHLQPQCWGGKP